MNITLKYFNRNYYDYFLYKIFYKFSIISKYCAGLFKLSLIYVVSKIVTYQGVTYDYR